MLRYRGEDVVELHLLAALRQAAREQLIPTGPQQRRVAVVSATHRRNGVNFY